MLRRARKQITDYLRHEIRSGRVKPGTKLPTTHELAASWHTPLTTVHHAVIPLVKEGLLVRIPRRGTFVRKQEERLTCVGIYHNQKYWTKGASDFEWATHLAITEELNRLGIEARVWIDARPASEQGTRWEELSRAAEHREIQGLIAFPGGRLSWLDELSVPYVSFSSANIPNTVTTDLRDLAELSLRHLVKEGCRSVGLIFPADSVSTNPDGTRHPYADFLEHFTDLVRDFGLTVKNEWIRIHPLGRNLCGASEQEHYGYEAFLELWNQPEKPEGLVVFPDTVVRGVIVGLREKQVRVPEELKLVLHKNEACELMCPMPAMFAVSSEKEAARALIEQIQKQIRGEVCKPILLPFQLMAHNHLAR